MNMPNAFIAKYYPHAIAQARGVPFPFLNVGLLLVAGKISRATKWQAGELSSKLRGGAKQALALAKLQEMQRAHNLDAYDESGKPCPREAKAQAPICYVGNCG